MTGVLALRRGEEVPLGEEEDTNVSTVDAQAVPGEMEEMKSPEEELKEAVAEEQKESLASEGRRPPVR